LARLNLTQLYQQEVIDSLVPGRELTPLNQRILRFFFIPAAKWIGGTCAENDSDLSDLLSCLVRVRSIFDIC
jgi:hypothetical protein